MRRIIDALKEQNKIAEHGQLMVAQMRLFTVSYSMMAAPPEEAGVFRAEYEWLQNEIRRLGADPINIVMLKPQGG